MALASAVKEAIWFRKIFEHTTSKSATDPVLIFVDNVRGDQNVEERLIQYTDETYRYPIPLRQGRTFEKPVLN